MSCSIASVTSYLSENDAENLQNGYACLAQIPDFEMVYLDNHLVHCTVSKPEYTNTLKGKLCTQTLELTNHFAPWCSHTIMTTDDLTLVQDRVI